MNMTLIYLVLRVDKKTARGLPGWTMSRTDTMNNHLAVCTNVAPEIMEEAKIIKAETSSRKANLDNTNAGRAIVPPQLMGSSQIMPPSSGKCNSIICLEILLYLIYLLQH
jgi:hypothetical protein